MTDIVERLRQAANPGTPVGELFTEAADLVERLRDVSRGGWPDADEAAAEIERRHAEIVRLKLVIQLGVAMRMHQVAYFKTRSKEDLIASKTAEKAFDRAVEANLES